MSARYSVDNVLLDADWGEAISSREFKRRYNGPFKGDGWYLLVVGDAKAVILALNEDGIVRTRGWFVPDLETAKRKIAESGFSTLPIREQEF